MIYLPDVFNFSYRFYASLCFLLLRKKLPQRSYHKIGGLKQETSLSEGKKEKVRVEGGGREARKKQGERKQAKQNTSA